MMSDETIGDEAMSGDQVEVAAAAQDQSAQDQAGDQDQEAQAKAARVAGHEWSGFTVISSRTIHELELEIQAMYHTKPPQDAGWYWVRFADGEAAMCYWNPEDDDDHDPAVLMAGFENGPLRSGRSRLRVVAVSLNRVAAWIGPLQSPFGDFATDVAYFAEDLYLLAQEEGKDLVMGHVESAGDKSGGIIDGLKGVASVTSTGLMEHGLALNRVAGIFGRDEQSPPKVNVKV